METCVYVYVYVRAYVDVYVMVCVPRCLGVPLSVWILSAAISVCATSVCAGSMCLCVSVSLPPTPGVSICDTGTRPPSATPPPSRNDRQLDGHRRQAAPPSQTISKHSTGTNHRQHTVTHHWHAATVTNRLTHRQQAAGERTEHTTADCRPRTTVSGIAGHRGDDGGPATISASVTIVSNLTRTGPISKPSSSRPIRRRRGRKQRAGSISTRVAGRPGRNRHTSSTPRTRTGAVAWPGAVSSGLQSLCTVAFTGRWRADPATRLIAQDPGPKSRTQAVVV